MAGRAHFGKGGGAVGAAHNARVRYSDRERRKNTTTYDNSSDDIPSHLAHAESSRAAKVEWKRGKQKTANVSKEDHDVGPVAAAQIYFSLRRRPMETIERTSLTMTLMLTNIQRSLQSYDTENLVLALRELYHVEAVNTAHEEDSDFRDSLAEAFCTRRFVEELMDIDGGPRPYLQRLVLRDGGQGHDSHAVIFFMEVMRRALLKLLLRFELSGIYDLR
ncbi:MAG: hypothetical protein L6R40_005734 [Gallowayella cf. fulva]|nr:MAG: hypothetical protein L6R40_005734 [Xanthomendoza cf. fulva]